MIQNVVLTMVLFAFNTSNVIIDFTKQTALSNWQVVDDVVMGGKSSGSFGITKNGYGVFEGRVSLENNGGFSSVRHRMDRCPVQNHKFITIRLKGDGKSYQFRVKANSGDSYSYIFPFSTSGKWEEVKIPLEAMYPSFRGRKLNLPTFNHDFITEVTFLIANKKEESFKLLVDRICLE